MKQMLVTDGAAILTVDAPSDLSFPQTDGPEVTIELAGAIVATTFRVGEVEAFIEMLKRSIR